MAAQFTVGQYNALCAAIGQGVTSVKYGDKEVTYRSFDEMLRTKKLMEAELGISKGPRRKYLQHTKGIS